MRRRAWILPLVVVAAAGCTVEASIGAKSVSPDELEKQIAAKSTQEGLTPSSVQCDDSLSAKINATAACIVLANDLKYTATVRATKIKGSTVSFDLRIPPPAVVPVETLEDQARQVIGPRIDGEIASFTCDDELEGTVDATTQCQLETDEGQVVDLLVTVTEADFTSVDFRFDPN